MKRSAIYVLLLVTGIFMLGGCTVRPEVDVPAVKDENIQRLQIAATLFPQYDFARQIAGDRADVALLLPPGVESHSYEPAPSDMIRISQSDLFIYTGENMEVWSRKIIEGMLDSGSDSMILDISENMDLVKPDETGGEHRHEGEEGHLYAYDPHIWTDPVNAMVMVADISKALCGLDPENTDYYRERAEKYTAELEALDEEFKAVVNGGKRKEILFGSRFALYYFAERYGLSYKAAFDSCSSETEPSAAAVAELIEEIRKNRIPVIYFAEMEDPKVARTISTETGAKMLMLHSCHNLTREELENGATYLSLMKQNAENLKEGLK